MYGGIDLGGTKIEACLHDNSFNALERRRVPTPSTYPELLKALSDQVKWLEQVSTYVDLPIGIGIPGLIDAHTGLAYAVNLCAMGKPLANDLAQHIGKTVPIENDCRCFALSEANGGAGSHSISTFGLIIGTGVGSGLCLNGKLYNGWSGGCGEVGHMGIPAHIASAFNLPLFKCGCSRTGCYEAYIGGAGITRLGQYLCNIPFNGKTLAIALAAKDPQAQKVIAAWAAIAAELIQTIQVTFDPECIVLGGGLSLLPNINQIITEAFKQVKLTSTRMPLITIAQFGDSSGVRGAAMLTNKI
ncbi:N-acetylgalactosamine kinase AgaK [Commensalibacter sp. Nvir]|uniref:ROK family protein n=1 Tax=Commensalibacter sp. Nvir TaxID=3069817 RepID=UPI002D37421E|nr:N-acetylgalactosamine kinase AgaK [Commensalibacter sp. Nvir]